MNRRVKSLFSTSDSLAGRIGIIELGTFKMNELLEKPLPTFYSIFKQTLSDKTLIHLKSIQNKTSQDPLASCLKGGYPKPVISNKEQFYDDWMENYFQTYINKDIKKLFPKLDSIKYRRFISMLSELSGTIINKAQIGRSIDVNEVTIRDYLDIANKTFFWRIIPSYEKTKIKSITKMPKGILRDAGILHFLSDINSREKMFRSPKIGQNFESFVIEEIIKGIQATNTIKWNYSYFRTKHGGEVDLILEGRFDLLPIEIKFATSTNMKSLTSLSRFIIEHNAPFGIVINNSDEIKLISKNIIQIPVSYI